MSLPASILMQSNLDFLQEEEALFADKLAIFWEEAMHHSLVFYRLNSTAQGFFYFFLLEMLKVLQDLHLSIWR